MSESYLGIIVGGGPAPGINGVIGSAAIEAINNGLKVRGFYDGFRHLTSGEFDPAAHSLELDIGDVARVHFEGGSILRTARRSLLDEQRVSASTVVAPDEQKVERVLANLERLNISYLVTIGGDDTALSARFVAERSGGRLRVVHVPKTIDNDLPLPGDVNTFGFATARHLGAELVANLMQDSKTTGRWYIAVTMGRNAGFLALGIGKAAGATVTLINEEFPDNIRLSDIVDVLEGSILKRRAMGRPDGVAVLAEGLAYKLGNREELERLLGREVPVDAAGHPRLAEFPLDQMLKSELQKRFEARGDKVTLVAETLGYELRCARPTPFDMAYCRDLGHGAVRLLLDSGREHPAGLMVTIQDGNIRPMDFQDMVDPDTNRTRIRQVDLNSDSYRVARAYMIRLEQDDFDSPTKLDALARAARMTPHEFRRRFDPRLRSAVTDHAPTPAGLMQPIPVQQACEDLEVVPL